MSDSKSEDKKSIIIDEVPEPSSSITLEFFVYIHKIYTYVYTIFLVLLFIFKKHAYDYPEYTVIYEVILLLVLLLINIFRIRLTSIGNKTERALILLFAVILGIAVLILYIFFMIIQTFVTNFDFAFSLIGLIITAFELLFSILTMFYIKVHEKTM